MSSKTFFVVITKFKSFNLKRVMVKSREQILKDYNDKRKRRRSEISFATKSFKSYIEKPVSEIILGTGYSGEIGTFPISDGNYAITLSYQLEAKTEEPPSLKEKYLIKQETDFIEQLNNDVSQENSEKTEQKSDVSENFTEVEVETSLPDLPDIKPIPVVNPPAPFEDTKNLTPPTPAPRDPIPDIDDEPRPEIAHIPQQEISRRVSSVPEREILRKEEMSPRRLKRVRKPSRSQRDDEFEEYKKYKAYMEKKRRRSRQPVYSDSDVSDESLSEDESYFDAYSKQTPYRDPIPYDNSSYAPPKQKHADVNPYNRFGIPTQQRPKFKFL